MNKEMFELKKSHGNGTRKSLKKRKVGSNVFLKITDLYTIELIPLNKLKSKCFCNYAYYHIYLCYERFFKTNLSPKRQKFVHCTRYVFETWKLTLFLGLILI